MSSINLFVKEANYDSYPDIVDVSLDDLCKYETLLVVVAREAQKYRLNKLKDQGLHNATIVGVWDLAGKPFHTLSSYHAVYIVDPNRIGYPALKQQWERLIKWYGK